METRRNAVNILAVGAAILTLPELGAVVSADWIPPIAAAAAVLNTLLTWLRPLINRT